MPKGPSEVAGSMKLAGAIVLAVGLLGACSTSADVPDVQSGEAVRPPSPQSEAAEVMIEDPSPCQEAALPPGANFDERYPQYEGLDWYGTARDDVPQADCLHSVDDVSRIVLRMFPQDVPDVHLGLDFETGEIYLSGSHRVWGSDDSMFSVDDKEVLPEEALAQLRALLEEHDVVAWPFEKFVRTDDDPEIPEGLGDGHELALLFKDGTGSYKMDWNHPKARALAVKLSQFMDQWAPEADFTPEPFEWEHD